MKLDNDDLTCQLYEATMALGMESKRRQVAEEDIVRMQESQKCTEEQLLESTGKLEQLQSILSSLSSAVDIAMPALQDIRQSTNIFIGAKGRKPSELH